MALNFTATTAVESSGKGRIAKGILTFDSSYPTGGEVYDPSLFGLSIVEVVDFAESVSGNIFEHDKTNKKIKAFSGGSSSGTSGVGSSHNHTLTSDDPINKLVIRERIAVSSSSAILANDYVYILSVDVTAGAVTGPFKITADESPSSSGEVRLNPSPNQLLFHGADAVTEVLVTYITSSGIFKKSDVTNDDVIVASSTGVNTSFRAAMMQYVFDETSNTLLTPVPVGEAPGATEYSLDINNSGSTTITTNAAINGNSLRVTYFKFSGLPDESMFIDDADQNLLDETMKMSRFGSSVSVSNSTSTLSPYYESDINSSTKPTIALTHNADPVTNLNANPLFITETYGDSQAGVGILQSNCNGAADVLGETADGIGGGVAASCRFFVKHNATPSGVQIYVNEGASDQLTANFPSGNDCYIVMPFEQAAGGIPGHAVRVLVIHDAGAAAYKPLYFDDNGAADAQLCFVDTGAVGGTIPASAVSELGNNYLDQVSGNLGVASPQNATVTMTDNSYDGLIIPGHGCFVVGEDAGGGNSTAVLSSIQGSEANGIAVYDYIKNEIVTKDTNPMVTTSMSYIVIPSIIQNDGPAVGTTDNELSHTHAISSSSASEVGNGTDLSTVSVEVTVRGV